MYSAYALLARSVLVGNQTAQSQAVTYESDEIVNRYAPKICTAVMELPKNKQLDVMSRISCRSVVILAQTHFENASKGKHQPSCRSDEEHRRDVQPERHAGVAYHDQRAYPQEFAERSHSFGKRDEAGVDDGADLIVSSAWFGGLTGA